MTQKGPRDLKRRMPGTKGGLIDRRRGSIRPAADTREPAAGSASFHCFFTLRSRNNLRKSAASFQRSHPPPLLHGRLLEIRCQSPGRPVSSTTQVSGMERYGWLGRRKKSQRSDVIFYEPINLTKNYIFLPPSFHDFFE